MGQAFRKESVVEVLPEPIRPASYQKIYKTIRLQNGLTALLISDPEESEEESGSEHLSGTESEGAASTHSNTDHGTSWCEYSEEEYAACSLTVGVGSFSDPPDMQGLAHFVEHMLFLGSEKYPQENNLNGNASTDCEMTTYYFTTHEENLPRAMDIFSQFFISPLMKKEAMQREREAIDSEFALKAPLDVVRNDQLLFSLFPAGHPARTFTWGNLKSLKDDIADDEKLYNAAHEFRKRHYSAHRMTVAVQARMDLSALEQYVTDTFGRVPVNKLPPEDFTAHSFRLDDVTPEFSSLYYVKPVGDITEVQLTWCLHSLISKYESKAHHYISYLLGHEGKGSLLSYLRKKVWALGIYTGSPESGKYYTSMYSLFLTIIVLTKDGLDNIDEVLKAIFSYISMLRQLGPSERIFNEIKTIKDIDLHFEEECKPLYYVQNLSKNMQHYPPEHYITGDTLYYKYDPEAITELLECMRADKVNIMVLSNKHARPVRYDTKEQWFGTEYTRQEIPKEWLDCWLNATPFPEFHLPEQNIYITTNFDLIPPDQVYLETAEELGVDLKNSFQEDIHKKTVLSDLKTRVLRKGDLIATVNHFRLDQPNLLRKNRNMELWYKPECHFWFPAAFLYFYFITPLSLKSPREACLLDLWTDVLDQGLIEELYPANNAYLSHSLQVAHKGLTLKVNGYSQNLHLLVELIVREMKSSPPLVSEKNFEAVREVRARVYHNWLLNPHKLANDVRMNVLLEPYISPRDLAALVHNVTLADLKEFHQRLLSRMYVKVLVQGNLPWDRAVTIAENVHGALQWEGVGESEMPAFKVHRLPLGERKLRVASLNPASTISILTNYYQADAATPRDTAIVEILMLLMRAPAFTTLRTNEQLGYSVSASKCDVCGVPGFTVNVNTEVDKFSVSHVDARVEAFLAKFARDMRRLTKERLSNVKDSIEHFKHISDAELKDEVERNWKEIVKNDYKFQRLYDEAEAIHAVRLGEFKNWVDNHLPTGNKSKFRKLSVQIMGHSVRDRKSNTTVSEEHVKNYNLTFLDASQSNGDTDENSADFITDMDAFRHGLPVVEVEKVELAQCWIVTRQIVNECRLGDGTP